MSITKIGVIEKVRFGLGGYQDTQIVFEFFLSMGSTSTIHTMECGFHHVTEDELFEFPHRYNWNHRDRCMRIGELAWEVVKLMKDAKVSDLNALVGKPVEVRLESEYGRNLGFRILKEAVL